MKKRIVSVLWCLCILLAIVINAAIVSIPDSQLHTKENTEGMKLVLAKKISYLDGKMSYSAEFEYDFHGRLIKTTSYDRSADREIYCDWEYDENDNVIRYHQAYGYGNDVYEENQYDMYGNILQKTIYYEYDGSTRRINYEYDEQGKLLLETKIVESEHNPNGSPENRKRYEYDEQGNIAQMIEEDMSPYFGGLFRHIYKYDEQGNLIQDMCFHDGEGWKDEYGYDMRGNMVWEIVYDSGQNIIRQYRYEYDAQNNLIHKFFYNSDGDLKYQYQYEYDAKGNEIKEIGHEIYENTLVKGNSYITRREYVWIVLE